MRPQQEVLRKLVTEYQKTKDIKAFEGILKRVDHIVISVVYTLKRKLVHLHSVPFCDLYQSAIVGVGEAICTAKDNEDGNKITARIVAYIKYIFRKNFKPPKELSGGDAISGFMQVNTNSKESDFTKQIDLVDFCNVRCYSCLNNIERDLIYKRFFKNMTYEEIGKTVNCKKGAARLRILKIINKLKELNKKEEF